MPSIIKVDQIQSDLGTVNVSSNLQFSSGFTMLSPTLTTPTLSSPTLTTPTTSGVMTLGAGIKFPATQVSSDDANTLDDYEEGTWTPSLNRTITPATISYDSRAARYTKIGNTVSISGFMNWGTNSGGSGSWQIIGLPFTVLNSTAAYSQLTANDINGIDFPAGYTGFGGYANINGTGYTIVCYGDNVVTNSGSVILNNSGFIYFSAVYTASA